MKYFGCHLLLFCMMSLQAYSQTWHTLYNGLYLSHFEQLPGHEIILTGSSFGWMSPDSTNIILIKTDSIGNMAWSKGFGSSGNEYANYVNQCQDSGFIIAGNTTAFNSRSNDVILIKTDKQGTVEWSMAYGGDSTDQPAVVLQTPDKGYIIGGSTHSLAFFPGSMDLFLMKTDSLGNVLWIKTYGDVGDNNLYNLEFTSDSSYLIVARTGNFSAYGLFNFYLMKIDKSGIALWQRGFGTAIDDYPSTGHETMDGGYIVCGTTWGSNADMYVVKTNSAGLIEWAKQYGSATDNNFASDIIQTPDSNYVVTGKTDLLSETVATIMKLDKNGDTLWTRTDSEYQWDWGTQIRTTTNGYLIQTKSFLFKTDTLGVSICNGRSITYYYNNISTSNYTTLPQTTMPYWNNIRTITIDTTSGVSSSPGCINSSSFDKSINNVSMAYVVPNPVSDNTFRINLPMNDFRFCILKFMDRYGNLLNETRVSPENNGQYSYINYSLSKPIPNGLYFIQIVFPDVNFNLKLIVLK